MVEPELVKHPTPEEREARGRKARAAAPRDGHAGWEPPSERVGPVSVLQQQAKTRVPELVPIRNARMATSPFAFFRGAAAIMAADLAPAPVSGLSVQCCGDAHLANFGGYAAPDRSLVFDINDFDETLPGPWEWDVKRLVASFEIAARSREFDAKTCSRIVERSARSYREAMREYATMRNLDLWYSRLDESDVHARFDDRVPAAALKRFRKGVEKARRKNSLRAEARLTERVGGKLRIVSDPPLISRLEDLFDAAEAVQLARVLHEWLRGYRQSLQPDRRRLLESFELVDVARKVVGVGSVGTRCWIAYMRGRDSSDPLFLQIKEAEASVLESHLANSAYGNHGRRVVEGQRLMQSASDIFLGWHRAKDPSGTSRDFYVRQLWDGKLSPQIEVMEPEVLEAFGEMCGSTLARAHARSGDRIAIASYLGGGSAFDRALTRFATDYAEQNQRDFEQVVAAIHDGRLPADAGEMQ